MITQFWNLVPKVKYIADNLLSLRR